MNRKSFQLSLGALFLATFTFAIGLVVGMRANIYEKERQQTIEVLRLQRKASEVLSEILQERVVTQKQDIEALKKSHAEELQRLKDERGE